MCEHCHMEYCCLHGHRRYGCYGPRFEPIEPPRDPRTARELLEEEKALLERRLKNLEARLAEG